MADVNGFTKAAVRREGDSVVMYDSNGTALFLAQPDNGHCNAIRYAIRNVIFFLFDLGDTGNYRLFDATRLPSLDDNQGMLPTNHPSYVGVFDLVVTSDAVMFELDEQGGHNHATFLVRRKTSSSFKDLKHYGIWYWFGAQEPQHDTFFILPGADVDTRAMETQRAMVTAIGAVRSGVPPNKVAVGPLVRTSTVDHAAVPCRSRVGSAFRNSSSNICMDGHDGSRVLELAALPTKECDLYYKLTDVDALASFGFALGQLEFVEFRMKRVRELACGILLGAAWISVSVYIPFLIWSTFVDCSCSVKPEYQTRW